MKNNIDKEDFKETLKSFLNFLGEKDIVLNEEGDSWEWNGEDEIHTTEYNAISDIWLSELVDEYFNEDD